MFRVVRRLKPMYKKAEHLEVYLMSTVQTRFVVLMIAGLALAACGRAGAPLTPHQSAVKQAKADKTEPPAKPVKDRPFILDGLLE